MTISFNHTIVASRDKQQSAEFLAELFDLPSPTPFGHFLVVALEHGASLDYADVPEGEEIRRQHFNEMARLCFFGQDAEPVLESLIERTPAAIEQVGARLPEHFPERVAQRIFAGLQHSADRLAEMSR